MGYVYILKCRDGKFYTGSTADLLARFRQHADGEVKFTSRRLPVQLAWSQEFESLEEAYVVEHQIKGWSRAKKIALIEGHLHDLPRLASVGPTEEMSLTLAAQRKIAQQTQTLRRAGELPTNGARLETMPVDAVTRRGGRDWTPRAARQRPSTGPTGP